MTRYVTAVLISVGLTTQVQAQQRSAAQQLIDAAALALGGPEGIRSARTMVLEGTGENFNLGQNLRPDAPLPRYEVTAFRRAVDFGAGRWRQEQTRVPRFVTGNAAPQVQVTALDGNVAFNVAPTGAGARANAEVAAARQRELWQHPLAVLQLAQRPDVTLSQPRTSGRETLVDVRGPDGLNFTLAVTTGSNLPARVFYPTSHANLGDAEAAVEFGDYRASGGLRLPHRIITRLDRYITSDIRLRSVQVNGETGDLAAPADVRAAAPPATPAINVQVEDLAPGVWRLAGQSHHSVVVELDDQLLLIEAPQNEARTLAVIQRARELRPGKPLNQVVVTHHHFDHSGGIRAAAAEGLTIVTHEGNVEFVRTMLARSHTLAPDALARRPVPTPRIRGIAGNESIQNKVHLMFVSGNQHSQTMLIVFLPEHGILVQADMFTPPPANPPPGLTFPFMKAVLDHVRKHNMQVSRVAGIHGAVVPWSDFERAAQLRD
ncbi:MAG: MBL fold metallo-hydrolase [Longimicrobiales bacterium]